VLSAGRCSARPCLANEFAATTTRSRPAATASRHGARAEQILRLVASAINDVLPDDVAVPPPKRDAEGAPCSSQHPAPWPVPRSRICHAFMG